MNSLPIQKQSFDGAHVPGRPEGESVHFSPLSQVNGQHLLVFPGLPTQLSPYRSISMPTFPFSGTKITFYSLKKDLILPGKAYFHKKSKLENASLKLFKRLIIKISVIHRILQVLK